jgi:hypothetical protein
MAIYYKLKIRCPACIAMGRSGGIPSFWYHDSCGGRLEVGDDACYRCSLCGYTSHIKNWRYACESHQSSYRETNTNHFADAISTAGQFSDTGGRMWLLRLLENLEDW